MNPDPKSMDISPAKPSRMKKLMNTVVKIMSSPNKSASQTTQVVEESVTAERPKRSISRPQMYQSDVEAEKEKEKRKGQI